MRTAQLVTPPVDIAGATTPPIPSSSPGIDMMDISPLPHKAPFFVAQVTLPSPSPEETPTDDMNVITPGRSDREPNPMRVVPVEAPTFLQLPEYVLILGYPRGHAN